jgi:hypothetical protein
MPGHEYERHVGCALCSLHLLLYHMERVQSFATGPDEKKVIGGCAEPLAAILDALTRLQEPFQD